MKRIAIIAEVKTKLKTNEPVEAINLYISNLFKKSIDYVQKKKNIGKKDIYILSKKGLIHSSKKLLPYETENKELNQAWAENVVFQIEKLFPNKNKIEIEFHAGVEYLKKILPILDVKGYKYEIPTPKYGLGGKLKWYKEQLAGNVVNIAFKSVSENKKQVKANISISQKLIQLSMKDLSSANIKNLVNALILVSKGQKELSSLVEEPLRRMKIFIKKQMSLDKDIKQLNDKLKIKLNKDKNAEKAFNKYLKLSIECFEENLSKFDEFTRFYSEFKCHFRGIQKLHETIEIKQNYKMMNEHDLLSSLTLLSRQLLKSA